MRILVVEDEVLIRMTTVDMVQSLGHEVFEAGNADEALDLVSGHPIDLVMTDVGLPGRSGTELAREIRSQWPHIKIIFATGHRVERDKFDTALQSGVVTIDKPYDERTIETAIGTVRTA